MVARQDARGAVSYTHLDVYKRQLVRSSNDAIIGKTTDGIVVFWNEAAECLYGYEADEMKMCIRDRRGIAPGGGPCGYTG